MTNNKYPFINIPLPYRYNALEPWIDTKTMMLHHDAHLQTYIDNLNALLESNPDLQQFTLTQLISIAPSLDEPLSTHLINNAGGVFNHRFFFNTISPNCNQVSCNELIMAITKQYGSLDDFKALFKAEALSVFGSGYTWLVKTIDGNLDIVTTPNQNTPDFSQNILILNLDVWEHAYYLKNYNKRAEYFENWWHVINWNAASHYYKYQ